MTGAIELWLMVDAAPAAAAVALTLPPDAILANGASGAGGQEVRQRLCDADFDGNGAVGGSDFSLLRRCFGGALDGACAETDMNSDGVVGPPDFDRFRSHFGGEPCTDVF